MTTKCCKCDKVRIGNHWTDIMKLADEDRFSHSYCPDCLLTFREEMRQQRDSEFIAASS